MNNIINLIRNKSRICPWWLCFTFDNPLRKLIHNPVKILAPYVKKGDSVLDLGPGMGYFTIPLCAITGNDGLVYAVDVQKEMLERIERRAKRNNISNLKTYLIRDSLDINSDFDFILLFWMLHEVGSKELLLRQLHDKLKNSGSLLIVEPKMHINQKYFDNEIDLAENAGLKVTSYPPIALSRTALFTKKIT